MDTTKVIFDCPLPPWLVVAAAAVLLAVVVRFLRRDAAHLRPLVRRVILALVAAAAVMLTGVVLSPKVIRTWVDPHKPLCSVLIDGSRSMLLADSVDVGLGRWLDGHPNLPKVPTPRRPNLREVKAAGPRQVAREEVVRLLLDSGPDGWVPKLQRDFDLAGWRFAGGLDALPLGAGATPFKVDEEGYSTALGDALDAAVNRTGDVGDVHPRAVVLVSDGAWNTGSDPSEIARVLGRLGVPVFVIGVGNPSPPRDAAVVSVHAPRTALVRDEVVLTAEVAATGMGAAALSVQLLRGVDVVAEQHVVALPSGRPVKVTFTQVPDAPGLRSYVVRVPKQEGEQDESNNSAKASIIVEERRIRVLLVEDEPRWEFRFLRNVFERDPAVELTISLQRPRLGPIKGQGYLAALPTEKKDLANYDLVVLGDLPRERLPDDFLKGMVDLVKIRGGALIVIPGRRHRSGALAGSPLADILPVSLDGAAGAEGRGEPFSVELTQDGASHLVTRLSSDPEENEALWSNLPPMHWSASVAGLARGATALAVHPYRLAGASKLPLIAVQPVGAGKVMFCGVEETWRWRQAVGDKYHYRFWAQAVRWMVKKQFAEGDPRARLSLDRTECDLGEGVEVEAYCLGPDGFPLEKARVGVLIEAEAPAEAGSGSSRHLALAAVPGGWGLYRGLFKPDAPGRYTLRPVVSIYGDEPLSSSVTLTVTRADLERRSFAQDLNTLSAIAQASGGRYLSVDESDRLPSLLAAKVERRVLTAEHSPCRHWAYYSGLALLLTAAWLIRKRSGLA